MRTLTTCLFLSLWSAASLAQAQPAPTGPDPWTPLLEGPQAALAKHDLSWIPRAAPPKRGRKLEPFLESEQPIARDQLSYHGYRLPQCLEPYSKVHSLPSQLRHPHHVYRYREFTILTDSDGRREQLCVYATARALELLRARWPREFEVLFRGPQTAAAQLAELRRRDAKKAVNFLNLDRAHTFVWQGRGGGAIAASSYDLGTKARIELEDGGRKRSLDLFRNVSTTYLNFTAIQGFRTEKLYRRSPLSENFLRYLRDGLIETLVHEALHNLLRRDKNVRPLFWALTHSLRKTEGNARGKEVEEAFVSNVSRRLLEGKGLAAEVSGFYGGRLRRTQARRLGILPGKETPEGERLLSALRKLRPGRDWEALLSFEITPGAR